MKKVTLYLYNLHGFVELLQFGILKVPLVLRIHFLSVKEQTSLKMLIEKCIVGGIT